MVSAKFGPPQPKKSIESLSEGIIGPDEYLSFVTFENIMDYKEKDNFRL
jgi:hypothetical protein